PVRLLHGPAAQVAHGGTGLPARLTGHGPRLFRRGARDLAGGLFGLTGRRGGLRPDLLPGVPGPGPGPGVYGLPHRRLPLVRWPARGPVSRTPWSRRGSGARASPVTVRPRTGGRLRWFDTLWEEMPKGKRWAGWEGWRDGREVSGGGAASDV